MHNIVAVHPGTHDRFLVVGVPVYKFCQFHSLMESWEGFPVKQIACAFEVDTLFGEGDIRCLDQNRILFFDTDICHPVVTAVDVIYRADLFRVKNFIQAPLEMKWA